MNDKGTVAFHLCGLSTQADRLRDECTAHVVDIVRVVLIARFFGSLAHFLYGGTNSTGFILCFWNCGPRIARIASVV